MWVNGQLLGSAPLGALGQIDTGAAIGLGADLNGVAHLSGSLDEIRFSNTARTDFSSVLGAGAKPYTVDAQTIALYHLDETDDWIDEDRGIHFGINRGELELLPPGLVTGCSSLVTHCRKLAVRRNATFKTSSARARGTGVQEGCRSLPVPICASATVRER